MQIRLLFTLYIFSIANTAPVNEANNDIKENVELDTVDELESSHKNSTSLGNGESRAGIIDNLNPFSSNHEKPKDKTKDNENNNNNPLGSLFSNVPQIFNVSNPFEQLFSSQPGGNFLDNIKVFFVGTQGMVMPASAVLGGFQNLMQAFGNMGNLLQPPTLPFGQ